MPAEKFTRETKTAENDRKKDSTTIVHTIGMKTTLFLKINQTRIRNRTYESVFWICVYKEIIQLYRFSFDEAMTILYTYIYICVT